MKEQKIIEDKLKELKNNLSIKNKYDINNKPLVLSQGDTIGIAIQIETLKWVLNNKKPIT